MVYTSLYRQYRPDTFDKVIGQEHIVKTLKNQIKNGAVGHAYIFTGTRGTGKTSVAKIFARAVNCLNPVDGSPCGKCRCCEELASGNNFDILEIDAASNNSVDQIRELTDKINFPPTVGKYKVYIVDEVHMLSKSAHNALLKTLEEPPAHAIFILATTEIHQIPATILSRCLRFDFRLVPIALIAQRIRDIFNDIGVRFQPEAVELIASAGNGSVRDALSIADMCVSYCDKNVSYDGVLEVLGASDPKKLAVIARYMADGDTGEALKAVDEVFKLGKSVAILASDLANFFGNIIYVKTCAQAKEILSLPEEYYGEIAAMAQKYTSERCLYIMKTMSSLEGELRYSAQHRIIFEAALVRACSDGDSEDLKIRLLEQKVAGLEQKLQHLSKRDFERAPVKIKDAKQVLRAVASALETAGYQLLAFALLEADAETKGGDIIVKIPSKATLTLLSERGNRDILNARFLDASGLNLRLEEVTKLDEDKALPYIKDMFGAMLEIK
jgi:DNA polymerase-3 subunit gamma/tau